MTACLRWVTSASAVGLGARERRIQVGSEPQIIIDSHPDPSVQCPTDLPGPPGSD